MNANSRVAEPMGEAKTPPRPARPPLKAVPDARRDGTGDLRAVSDRVREVSPPWWFAAPSVAMTCAKVAAAPVLLAIKVAEGAVALALLAVLGLGVAWHQGYVSDKDVVAALRPVGQRVLAMVQGGAGN